MSADRIRALYAELQDVHRRLTELNQRFTEFLEEEGLASAPGAAVTPAPWESSKETAAPPADDTPVAPYQAPLVFINTGASEEQNEDLTPNGIDGTTGQPLLRIDAAAAARMAQGLAPETAGMKNLYSTKQIQASGGHFGVVADVDQNKIETARWAVVVSAADNVEVLKALWPLIRHRMEQMGYERLDFEDWKPGETCGTWLGRHTEKFTKKLTKENWGKIPPVMVVGPGGERVNPWLARHGTAQTQVDPEMGVPFYLMIVARPGPLNASDKAYIPFNFQYELDLFWGVGRLLFSDASGQHRLEDYRTYAERVVAWEKRAPADAAARLNNEIAFFGTHHAEDTSTKRSAEELITPLVDWAKDADSIPAKNRTGQRIYLAKDATRSNLEQLLSGDKPPALLFTASHGIGLQLGDERLVMQQGALLSADCGDYDPVKKSFPNLKPEHWLTGQDLDSMSKLNVEGMIAFLFACYGAGCPEKDEFIFNVDPDLKKKDRLMIAPFPFVAQLPQRLLAHGALAVIGHVERAWTYSFSGTEAKTNGQVQPFKDVLGRLLQGMPAGSATDQFNVIQGARSMSLTEELEMIQQGANVDAPLLSRLWMARNDARNYALIGDPAVKLATK